MFGPDDDEDFPSTANTKLASLFGQPMEEGNTSLTYTAPKQPKKSRSDTASPASGSTGKLNIIKVYAVQTYKLEGSNYNSQGKLGAALLGNTTSQLYQLILYKNKEQHITSTKITDAFQFTVQAKKFASFYDDRGQNWSIMFESEGNAVDFAREIGLARACVPSEKGEQPFYVQDLKVGEGSAAEVGDLLEVRYTTFPFVNGKLEKAIESNLEADKPQRVSIRKGVWEEALLGATKGSKKLVVLAPVLFGPWKPLADPNNRLVVEVEIGRIKTSRRSRDSTPIDTARRPDSSESNVDSSTDDTSIKARGASISEALTNSPKTHKASIISRMARMGQPTLPLKGAVMCNPSDSEETEEESSGTVPNASVPPKSVAKPRSLSNKRGLASQNTPSSSVVAQEVTSGIVGSVNPVTSHSGVPTQQISLYQPTSVGWHQQHLQQAQAPPQQYLLNGMPVNITSNPEGQLFASSHPLVQGPMVPTPTGTPSSESHLSVYFSENRTHNAEVRMGLTKVADKVDQVLGKIDALHQPAIVGVLEPRTLLASVQKLVFENEQLQEELADKRVKIEQQNEKIYQLLQQKFVEQSTSSNTLEQRQDSTLQGVILGLQQEKAKLTSDLTEALSRMNTIQIQATNFERIGVELREEIKNLTARLQVAYVELDHSKQALIDQENLMRSLKEKTDASVNLHDTQDSVINDLSSKVRELQTAKPLLETALVESKRQLESTKMNFSEQISLMEAAHKGEIEKLQKHYKELLDKRDQKSVTLERNDCCHQSDIKKLENENEELKQTTSHLQDQLKAASSSSIDDLKKVMNVMFRILKSEFVPGTSYDGFMIRETMLSSIQDVTLQYVKVKTESGIKIENKTKINSDESKVTPAGSENSTCEQKDKSDHPSKMLESLEKSNVKIENKKKINSDESKVTPTSSETSTCEQKDKSDNPSKMLESLEESNGIEPPFVSPQNEKTNEHLNKKDQNGKPESEKSDVKVNVLERQPEVVEPEHKQVTEQEPTPEIQTNTQNEETRTQEDKESAEQNLDGENEKKSLGPNLQVVKPRESSIERGWRPQPPPSPLFDDEEDDDDWLS